MVTPSVPLSMLLTKDVPYEWHDGVALVAQLLEQLRSINSLNPVVSPITIPDLASVALENTGWLTVSSGPERELPIMPGVAQLLQELLSGTDQPPQLRLYTMQVSTAESHVPVGQFADELSKWERPNRVQKLVSLYTRAVNTIGVAALTEEAKARQRNEARRLLDRRVSTGLEPGIAARKATLQATPTSLVIGSALVAVVGLVAILEWRYVLGHSAPQTPASATTVLEEAPAPAITPRAPAAPPATAAPRALRPKADPAPAPVETPPAAAPVAAAETELARAQDLFGQQDYANARAGFERILDSLRGDSSTQAEEIRQTARNLEEVARAAADTDAANVNQEYRSGDPGVTPPVPEAYLPPTPDPRTPADKLQVMELHINAVGDVDSAKFVINRATYRNAWWPAAAKTWHFKPATKDGKAVRYVMRIVMDDTDTPR